MRRARIFVLANAVGEVVEVTVVEGDEQAHVAAVYGAALEYGFAEKSHRDVVVR